MQCALVAEHLIAHDRVPALVLCSTATRTRQTWELVADGLPDAPPVRHLDPLYGADVLDVLTELADVPDDVAEVLVVGHEPTMSGVARYLAAAGSDPAALAQVGVGVATAALMLLETEQRWGDLGRGGSTLTAVLASPHASR